MKIIQTIIPDLFLIEPKIFGDARGYFFESYSKKKLQEIIKNSNEFVQDNRSYSTRKTLRGLHFQKPPFAQTKIVSVLSGTVLDVAVDIRRGSPTFGKHIAIELSGENKLQLYIPRGFAHGFVVLSDTAEFFYKCDNIYEPSAEGGILFYDPSLAIDWKIPREQMILSEKDIRWKNLNDTDTPFIYEK